ncbi:MAG TPA: alpha/beta fold hydrolase [Myxococcales bacterium]|nr:alpha/beta fold hydrolase [Myxococcales bacterium]
MLPFLLAALAVTEGDFLLRDFRFASGESLPELRIHYRTLGTPGAPAVLVLHGTTGSGAQFLGDSFAGELFGPGQPLDAATHFIVLPDNIGHGRSSKPSDGLRARFPHYGYRDMIEAQRRLLTEKLGVNHLRLIAGTSMGCMHSWMWAEAQPRFMDAVLALACLPVQIAGRNRVLREFVADSIRSDPAWNGGNYTAPPVGGLRGALEVLFFLGSAALPLQAQAPSRDEADKLAREWMAKRLAATDANDFLYAFESSRDYDPSPGLEKIEAAVTAVNSQDDEVNPPELGILEKEIRRVKRGKAVVLSIGPLTRGHGTHTNAPAWKDQLSDLLATSKR